MTTIKGSILTRRPGEEVFDFVADERNEPAYNPQLRSVEKTTPGPIGAGALRQAVATSGKRSTPFKLEVPEYTWPSRLGSMTRMATADVNGALTFVPAYTRAGLSHPSRRPAGTFDTSAAEEIGPMI